MTFATVRFVIAVLSLAGSGAAFAQATEREMMRDDNAPTTTVERNGLSMRAEFHYDGAKHIVRVRYLLANNGKAAVAIFDRGDSLMTSQNKLRAGAVAAPTRESTADGLVLRHRALPLRKPAPTVPPVPLAARVKPGAQQGGDVLAEIDDASRIRYCLGVATFDKTLFSAPQTIDRVDLWRASFKVVDKQFDLCTPWFDVAAQAFASD